MKQAKTAATLNAVVGGRLRELREARGVKQEDIAHAARAIGLPWMRSTIAAIELGNRDIRAGELLLLPAVLAQAGIQAKLHDLVPDDDTPVAVLPRVKIKARAIRAVLVPGTVSLAAKVDDIILSLSRKHAEIPSVFGETWKKICGENPPRFPSTRAVETYEESFGDAEQKAASGLGVPAMAIAIAARKLWSVSLSRERELRLAQKSVANRDPRALQALRGHITRELLSELQPLLERLHQQERKTR